MADLAQGVQSLNRRFGPATVMLMANALGGDAQGFVPTGSTALDEALGIGGVPRGRITEIYGPEGAGKTTLALSIAVQAQALGEVVAFVDAEQVLDWPYALRLGVDAQRFVINQPETAEEALEVCVALAQSGRVGVIILDSIAGLVPKAEVDTEVSDSHPGLLPSILGRSLRKLAGPLRENQVAMVVTNQLRRRVGVLYGNPETTTGGNALRYAASVRLDIRRVEAVKYQGRVVGQIVRVTVQKSRVGVPYRRAEFGLVYGVGLVDDVQAWLKEVRNGA
jgi:recombination protein RecA